MGRTIKTAAIEADWDDIVRIVASIKEGAVAPSAILRKLAAYKRQNRLDFALAELGRIERTLFALDWLEQPDLRRACQAGLNKGEARHTLAAAIYTNRQGRFTDRSIENQEYRARSEEHTSELQSLMRISYAVFCLKKKKNRQNQP